MLVCVRFAVSVARRLARQYSCFAVLSASPLAGILHDESADDAGGEADAAEDGDAEEPLLGDLVVDELAQVGGLQVGGLLVEEQVVVAAGLAVVAELVIAEGEVVQALAAALGGDAKDFGQEADAELLVAAVRGLDEALESRPVRERESQEWGMHVVWRRE